MVLFFITFHWLIWHEWQGVKHSYFSYFFLFFSLNSFFSYFSALIPIFPIFISDFKVKVKYGYVSQLYVRGMASLHLIYHPVEAEYKGQMSLDGSYWGEGGGGIPFSILDLFPNAECSREV